MGEEGGEGDPFVRIGEGFLGGWADFHDFGQFGGKKSRLH